MTTAITETGLSEVVMDAVSLDVFAVRDGAVIKMGIGLAKYVLRLDRSATDHLIRRLTDEPAARP